MLRATVVVMTAVTVPTAFLAPAPLKTGDGDAHITRIERLNHSMLGIAGKRTYARHCAGCHGNKGVGTELGPPLLHPIYFRSNLSRRDFHAAVQNGKSQQHWRFGDMPGFRAMSFNEVERLARYVYELQTIKH